MDKELQMKLFDLLNCIKPADNDAYEHCIYRFDHIAKPVGSLGKLETLLATIAAAQGTSEINIDKKSEIVL